MKRRVAVCLVALCSLLLPLAADVGAAPPASACVGAITFTTAYQMTSFSVNGSFATTVRVPNGWPYAPYNFPPAAPSLLYAYVPSGYGTIVVFWMNIGDAIGSQNLGGPNGLFWTWPNNISLAFDPPPNCPT